MSNVLVCDLPGHRMYQDEFPNRVCTCTGYDVTMNMIGTYSVGKFVLIQVVKNWLCNSIWQTRTSVNLFAWFYDSKAQRYCPSLVDLGYIG